MGNRQGGGAKDDTKTYRDGYPEETMDDLEMDLNVAFYTNKIASRVGTEIKSTISTRLGGVITTSWSRNIIIFSGCFLFMRRVDSTLISGIAETRSSSVYEEIPKRRARFLKSYDMILDFFGFEVVDRLTGRLERRKPAAVAMERLQNLENHGHNYMRITDYFEMFGRDGFRALQATVSGKLLEKRCIILVQSHLQNLDTIDTGRKR